MLCLISAMTRQIRSWTNPAFVWSLLVAPCLAIAVMVGVFDTGILADVPVAAVDLDNGSMSREVVRLIDALPSVNVVCKLQNPEEGNAMLHSSKVYGVVIVPKDFERDMLLNKAPQILVYLEGRHMSVAGVLKRDLTNLSGEYWQKQDTLLRLRTGVPFEAARKQSGNISIDLHAINNQAINYRTFLSRAMFPALFQLLLAMYLAYVLYGLRSSAMTETIRKAPVRTIIGTVFPPVIWSWLMLTAAAVIMHRTGYLALSCPFTELSLCYLAFAVTIAAVAIAINGMCDTPLQCFSVTSALAAPAFGFCGITFPSSAMSPLGAFWSGLMPLTHLMKVDAQVFQLGAPFLSQWRAEISMLIIALVFGSVGLILFRYRLMHYPVPSSAIPGSAM